MEFAFHACVCILMMGAFFPILRNVFGKQPGLLEGDPFQRTVLTAAYLLALLALAFHLREILPMIAATPVLWLLLLWATLSVLWSGFPDIAFRRMLALWLTSLYGLVLYLRFEFKQLLKLLGVALLVVVAGSLVLLVLFPQWAVMGSALLGKWRGVFIHKNHLGRFSALALLVAGYLFWTSRKSAMKVFWGLLIMASLVTLVGSQSLSAQLVVAGMVLCALFFKLLLRRRKLMWVWLGMFIVISGMALFWTANNFDRILTERLNKTANVSGRFPIWLNVAEKISERPWLGYGYGSFWLGTEGPAADVWKKLRWEVPHAHNGYLDLWLQLGLPGVCLAFYLLLRLFALSATFVSADNPAGWFWVLFFTYLLSYNMVESVLLVANSLFWVLIVYSCFYFKNRSFKPDFMAAGHAPTGRQGK